MGMRWLVGQSWVQGPRGLFEAPNGAARFWPWVRPWLAIIDFRSKFDAQIWIAPQQAMKQLDTVLAIP
jgi:hypothetical protein